MYCDCVNGAFQMKSNHGKLLIEAEVKRVNLLAGRRWMVVDCADVVIGGASDRRAAIVNLLPHMTPCSQPTIQPGTFWNWNMI